MKRAIAISFILGVLVGGAGTMTAWERGTRIYHVTDSGDDSGPCTEKQPCRDLEKTLKRMLKQDQMYVRDGVYIVPKSFILTLMRSIDAR